MLLILDIKNINDNVLTCLENPIVTAMNYFQRDPIMMFGASWTFSHNFMKEYNGIESAADIMRLVHNVELFTNVKLVIKKALDFDYVKKEIMHELEDKRPIIVYVDSSWCPWLTSYKNSLNTHHYVLIIGICIQKQEFYCLESSNMDLKILPFGDYINGMKEYIVFDIGDESGFNENDALVNIIENITNVDGSKGQSIFENIIEYSKQINQSFDIQMEIEGYNPFKFSPIFAWLRGVCKSRIKFTYALSYLEKFYCNSALYWHKQGIFNLEKKWSKIVIKLIRAIYSRNPEQIYQSIVKDLHEIAGLEREILQDLKNELLRMNKGYVKEY